MSDEGRSFFGRISVKPAKNVRFFWDGSPNVEGGTADNKRDVNILEYSNTYMTTHVIFVFLWKLKFSQQTKKKKKLITIYNI